MLTKDIIDQLSGKLSTSIATASLDGIPNYARCWGASAEEGDDSISFVLPIIVADIAIKNLKENPRVALNLADMSNYKTLQVKGVLLEIRDANEDEIKHAIATKEVSKETLAMFFGEKQAERWLAYKVAPSFLVRMSVEEAYDQTPGFYAGARII